MHIRYFFAVLLAVSVTTIGAQTPEVGRVLSSTALVQQVAVPQQVCFNEQVNTAGQKSGAGSVLGAIAGGVIGNNLGRGSNQSAAAVLGMVGGAIVGDRIETPGPNRQENVQRCTVQQVYENRTTGYQVVYEYAGKQYSVQMPQDPGPTIQLQVAPISSFSPIASAAPATPTVYAPSSAEVMASVSSIPPRVVYVQAPPIYVTRPVIVAPPVFYENNIRWGHGHGPGFGHGYRNGYGRPGW